MTLLSSGGRGNQSFPRYFMGNIESSSSVELHGFGDAKTNRSKKVENCNRVMREEPSQPTEPGWLQIFPKSRVTFKDAGKEGFGTTLRHYGEQMSYA